jgi:hypothetical protein
MGVAVEGHEQGEMTLVFTLSALEQFDDPEAVLDDARGWSRYVGLIDRHAAAVDSFVDEYDLDPEFDLGAEDKWLTMERLRETTATPRHVFVGTTDGDRTLANHLDWEYQTVPEVAENAGWEREGDSESPGPFERIQQWLGSVFSESNGR